MRYTKHFLVFVLGVAFLGFVYFAFMLPGQTSKLVLPVNERVAAQEVFVPPGEKDEFYMFVGGGHSGQIYVYGVPSMRQLGKIPVFTPDPAVGYGYDQKSKAMLKGYTWGDLHHPALSETDGKYDGRWIFASDVANNRLARINLSTFKTEEILGPIPNIMGPHGSAFITPNSEYVFMPSRFATPLPFGTYSPIEKYGQEYYGNMAAIKIDPDNGGMKSAWQLLLPPWQYEMSDAGKKVSAGWFFFTCFNSEEATHDLEINASQRDRDYLLAINWQEAEKAVQNGKYSVVSGQKMVDPRKVPGIAYLIPAAKSPHGAEVTPDGKYVVTGGKIASMVTVYDSQKIIKAAKNNWFTGSEWGLPIINYDKVKAAEIDVGIGALHTTFDNKGYAYTSLFAESVVARWKIGTWEVDDKIQVAYNPGHVEVVEGETTEPFGKYLISLNKWTKNRFLSTGPTHPDSAQLIDILGEKMRLLYEIPMPVEPHIATVIRADKIKAVPKYTVNASQQQAKIVRNGNRVEIFMTAVRTKFNPDIIEVNQGDSVVWHSTNIEHDPDIVHGIAIAMYNISMQVEPGETKTVVFTADKPGTFPFYCNNFCSTLHDEMQGWFLVKPSPESGG